MLLPNFFDPILTPKLKSNIPESTPFFTVTFLNIQKPKTYELCATFMGSKNRTGKTTNTSFHNMLIMFGYENPNMRNVLIVQNMLLILFHLKVMVFKGLNKAIYQQPVPST